MHYLPYLPENTHYPLDNGFALVKADVDSDDFVRHWAAYRPNEAFHQDWTERYTDIQGVPFCFWIQKDTVTVGGCLALSGTVAELFLIPPNDDYDASIREIIALVRQWSGDKVLKARYVLPEQISAFQKQGFVIDEQSQFMIRPAMPIEPALNSQFLVQQPVISDADAYADIFYAAFAGGVGLYGKRNRQQHLDSIQGYFEKDTVLSASSVVRDKTSLSIASICLVSVYGGHATINFVATHPAYQGHGLGQRVIQYAINHVYGHFSWVTLAVVLGNPAEHLYQKLGFKAGTVISTLVLT